MRRPKRNENIFTRMSLTDVLIVINVVAYILFLVFLAAIPGAMDYLALNPNLFLQGYVWTLITSMFLHAPIFIHIFVNMVSLFFIGNFVERLIGRKRYLWFYMIAGVIAGLAFVFFAYLGQFIEGGVAVFGSMDAYAVGASGALFGLGGLLAVLIPRLKVLVFFVIPMPMWLAMAVLMFGLWAISIPAGLPIGNTAHFGGLVVGVAYGFYLRKKYARKVQMLNRMFR
jgi:uncharacterized protein